MRKSKGQEKNKLTSVSNKNTYNHYKEKMLLETDADLKVS